eukprot:Rhum_TRINITY_DN14657_c3_g1::Rhum_TRINITY_DN14657_c3_g1_i1::g.106220::m.106220
MSAHTVAKQAPMARKSWERLRTVLASAGMADHHACAVERVVGNMSDDEALMSRVRVHAGTLQREVLCASRSGLPALEAPAAAPSAALLTTSSSAGSFEELASCSASHDSEYEFVEFVGGSGSGSGRVGGGGGGVAPRQASSSSHSSLSDSFGLFEADDAADEVAAAAAAAATAASPLPTPPQLPSQPPPPPPQAAAPQPQVRQSPELRVMVCNGFLGDGDDAAAAAAAAAAATATATAAAAAPAAGILHRTSEVASRIVAELVLSFERVWESLRATWASAWHSGGGKDAADKEASAEARAAWLAFLGTVLLIGLYAAKGMTGSVAGPFLSHVFSFVARQSHAL